MGAHIAINYHYVGMPSMPHPGIHGLDAAQFRAAMLDLAGRCILVSLADLLAAQAGERGLPDGACLITFDDGLRCQAEVALPILDELGLPAAFFALGAPYFRGKAATVHKLHYVRARFGDAAVSEAVTKVAVATGWEGSGPEFVDEAVALRHYRYDTPEVARLKYFLNYLAPSELTEAVTGTLLDAAGIGEAGFIRDFYMDHDALRHLAGRGLLGSHATSHRPLARMTDEECRLELAQSRDVLAGITGTALAAVSYPLGNAEAVDRRVGTIAAECGYRLGWTMERARNRGLADPLLLARVDAADCGQLAEFGFRSRYHSEEEIGP